MYDKYLGYAGVDVEKARASEGENMAGAKPGFRMEDAEMLAANDTGTVSDAGGKDEPENAELQNREKVRRQEQQDAHKQQNSDSNVPEGLGDLSGKYESGKDGSHAISSGEEDLGGKSYGKYQMTSVHNGKAGGTAQEFVTSEGFPWKDEFKGLTAGSKAFDKRWEKLADDHPEEFEKLQDKFIYDTHYVPVAKSVKEYGLDADKQSKTLQQVFWSTGVQHGPNTDVVKKAVENLKKENRFDPTSGEFEADLIDAIYEERKTRFESYSEEKQQVLKNRFDREKRDALNALKNERGKSDE